MQEASALYSWKEKVHENLKNGNIEIVKQWAENLTELALFGGEPLLSDDNLELLHFLADHGFSRNMTLLFNTNGTVYHQEIEDLLKSFHFVRINFSIDDIGQRFEYQRKGADWNQVLQNIEKAYRFSRSPEGKHLDFKVCTTVSTLNIFYFPEMFDFFHQHFPALRIYWNLLLCVFMKIKTNKINYLRLIN
jgi:sulfatase maturation enzyme AslB (radical SAM superfamily)